MTTTINIGDYALHTTTGNLGEVVAYGHKILDGVYLPTIKVEVKSSAGIRQRIFVEDLSKAWVPVERQKIENTWG